MPWDWSSIAPLAVMAVLAYVVYRKFSHSMGGAGTAEGQRARLTALCEPAASVEQACKVLDHWTVELEEDLPEQDASLAKALATAVEAHGLDVAAGHARDNLKQYLVLGMDYDKLAEVVGDLAARSYDSGDGGDEAKLERLWKALMPGVRRDGGRITKEWQEIGFQGSDPATDFRGAGVAGLEALVYFAEQHSDRARAILGNCRTRPNWYFFAIVGINLTFDALNLLRSGAARSFFFRYGSSVASFFELVAVLFCRLDELWEAENPASVMEFSRIQEMLLTTVESDLAQGELYSLNCSRKRPFPPPRPEFVVGSGKSTKDKSR